MFIFRLSVQNWKLKPKLKILLIQLNVRIIDIFLTFLVKIELNRPTVCKNKNQEEWENIGRKLSYIEDVGDSTPIRYVSVLSKVQGREDCQSVFGK